jgi:hypothetical protein
MTRRRTWIHNNIIATGINKQIDTVNSFLLILTVYICPPPSLNSGQQHCPHIRQRCKSHPIPWNAAQSSAPELLKNAPQFLLITLIA